MISICLLLLGALFANANVNNVSSIVRIYSNLAEIVRPLEKLPLRFTDEDWNEIRSDSFTLLGADVNVLLQTITNDKKLLNGTEVYIRSPLSGDISNIKLIRGVLVDENNYLVKIQDKLIAQNKPLYLTVPHNKIYYVEEPTKPTHFVNFTYTSGKSKVFVSYLQSSLNWRTAYQLNLFDNESELIAMADIRNNAKTPILIEKAELIGGDINLRKATRYEPELGSSRSTVVAYAMKNQQSASDEPTVEEGKELSGLYIFPITKPLKINGKTNHLLPMFRPTVSVQRYALISKPFSLQTVEGKAQRSYRLIADRYLPQGNCIVREHDRVVGETALPNLAKNDKYEFSVGEDADVCYKEYATLISSTNFNETESSIKSIGEKSTSPAVIIVRTRYIYEIKVKVENFKNRPVNVEYEQKGFYGYQTIKLTKAGEHLFNQEGSTIKSNMTLKAKTSENYLYTLELVR